MKTGVIIATYQRPSEVERLLHNLAGCAFPPEVEVWVVENGPRTGVEAIVAAQPLGGRARYLYRPVGMKSLALNDAIARSGAEFLIFLDDDVAVPPGIIEAYVEAARRHGPGCFFGGGLVAEAEIPCPPDLAPHLPRSARGWSYAAAETEIPAAEFDFFFGANWAAFRIDLERAGLFSPELGISASRKSSVGEETELQQRMIARGARPVYLPAATIGHPVPADCYTQQWVWRRRFRLGVTDWTLNHAGSRGRRLFGVPLWILRRLAAQRLRRAGLRLAGAPLAVRTDARMEEAHLAGLLHGAWQARRATAHPAEPTRPGPGAAPSPAASTR